MNFREELGQMIRDGRQPYSTTEDPSGNSRIHHVPHELDGYGVVHIFKDGWGTTHGYGNSFIIQGYWYNPAFEAAPDFNSLTLDHKDNLGRPSGNWVKISNVIYQEYEKGFIYKIDTDAPIVLYGQDFVTFMGESETVWDAIVANELIKWTVTFRAEDNSTIKTVSISHGQSAAGEAPIVTKEGFDFVRWSLDINNVTGNIDVTPVFGPKQYTVEFRDFDDTIITTQQVNYGNDAINPTNPTRIGYSFTGWDGTLTNIQSNIIVKATYDPITYSISYNPAGIEHVNPTTYTIETDTIILIAATPQSGYQFVRWTKNGTPITEIVKGTSGNIVLEATFEAIDYQINYLNLDHIRYLAK